MTPSFAYYHIIFAIVILLLTSAKLSSANRIHKETTTKTERIFRTAHVTIKNIKADLTLPEQYFFQTCLHQAFTMAHRENPLFTVEVLDQKPLEHPQHLRSLVDYSWLYDYTIFFFFDDDCDFDGNCPGGWLYNRRVLSEQWGHVSKHVCNKLRNGPFAVFHNASVCHIQFV